MKENQSMSKYGGRDRVAIFFGDGSGVVLENCLVSDLSIDQVENGCVLLVLRAACPDMSAVSFSGHGNLFDVVEDIDE
jgi:hypothetical protein